MADINQVVTAIEAYLEKFTARGAKAVSFQARASGDDVDVIKIFVDLGPASVDEHDWAHACEAAIVKDVPGASAFRYHVRAEKL